MKFRNRLEFGEKGPEGLIHEGVYEKQDWASLKKEPFAGNMSEAMIREADEINAMLGSIETSGFEDDQNTESETDVKIDDIKSQPEKYQDETLRQIDETQRQIEETLRQIEELKANLHKYFD